VLGSVSFSFLFSFFYAFGLLIFDMNRGHTGGSKFSIFVLMVLYFVTCKLSGCILPCVLCCFVCFPVIFI